MAVGMTVYCNVLKKCTLIGLKWPVSQYAKAVFGCRCQFRVAVAVLLPPCKWAKVNFCCVSQKLLHFYSW